MRANLVLSVGKGHNNSKTYVDEGRAEDGNLVRVFTEEGGRGIEGVASGVWFSSFCRRFEVLPAFLKGRGNENGVTLGEWVKSLR